MCHKIESFFQSITSPKSHKEMIGQSVKQGRKEGAKGAGKAREARGVATDEAINSVDVARPVERQEAKLGHGDGERGKEKKADSANSLCMLLLLLLLLLLFLLVRENKNNFEAR